MTKSGKLIGITGGVGSGKSLVLKYLKEACDCEILIADDIARDLQKKGGVCYAPMVEVFSEDALQTDGELDRAKIASMIFEDEDLRKKANAIVHPAVKEEVERITAGIRAHDPEKTVFLESAIFVEAGYLGILDELWLVCADKTKREERLRENRGYSREKIENIMESQFSDEEYRSYADVVIDNSGTMDETVRNVEKLFTGRWRSGKAL